MKYFCAVIIFATLLSCDSEEIKATKGAEISRYIINNSQKVGTLIKERLDNAQGVILYYPDYIAQSYELIRYIGAIMNLSFETRIFIDGLPASNSETDLIKKVLKNSPLYGFEEFLGLVNYLESIEVTVTNDLNRRTKLLILLPESRSDFLDVKIDKLLDRDKYIKLVMVGVSESSHLFDQINRLPKGKEIVEVPLIGSNILTLDSRYDSMVIMGSITEYRDITPIKLYNRDNYKEAPESFIEKHSSIIESKTITKLNSVLPKLISEFNEIYGERKSERD